MKGKRRNAAAWSGLVLGCSVVLALAGCGANGGGAHGGAQRVRIEVTDAGFTPGAITVHRGEPVTVVFARRTDRTCGTDVVFPTLHRGYDLPLNQEVTVQLAPADIGDTLKFSCSMDMLHGMFVAK